MIVPFLVIIAPSLTMVAAFLARITASTVAAATPSPSFHRLPVARGARGQGK
jgi:hypothetical protein